MSKRRRMKQIPMFEDVKPKRERSVGRTGVRRKRKLNVPLSQFYTPDDLAARIAEFALRDVEPRTVLEPSAGQGALVRALLGRAPALQITCIDLDPKNAHALLAEFTRSVFVSSADFLSFAPAQRFDLAVMNPPFDGGTAATHIRHALRFCDGVVAHCPITTLAGQQRRVGLWAQCELVAMAVCSTRPRYIGKGGETEMCTVRVQPIAAELEERDLLVPRSVAVEFWP